MHEMFKDKFFQQKKNQIPANSNNNNLNNIK